MPPSPRADHAAAVHAERYLLIFGGGSHATCFNDLHVLDLQAVRRITSTVLFLCNRITINIFDLNGFLDGMDKTHTTRGHTNSTGWTCRCDSRGELVYCWWWWQQEWYVFYNLSIWHLSYEIPLCLIHFPYKMKQLKETKENVIHSKEYFSYWFVLHSEWWRAQPMQVLTTLVK